MIPPPHLICCHKAHTKSAAMYARSSPNNEVGLLPFREDVEVQDEERMPRDDGDVVAVVVVVDDR